MFEAETYALYSITRCYLCSLAFCCLQKGVNSYYSCKNGVNCMNARRDEGLQCGKPRISNTQIWVFEKHTNLLVLVIRRKFHEFSGLNSFSNRFPFGRGGVDFLLRYHFMPGAVFLNLLQIDINQKETT